MWRLHVDTGGTFTDCVAIAPGGDRHTAKVLSTAALRARVIERPGPTRLRVETAWSGCDDLVAGFALVPLAAPDRSRRVVRFDAARGLIDVDGPLDAAVGDGCELRGAEPAPILAARLVTRTPAGRPLPPIDMRLGTTRGTNALLERAGAVTALYITRGLGDLVEIGDQQRPDLFALRIRKRPPFHTHVVEVDERLAADGTIVGPLADHHLDELADAGRRLVDEGVTAAAVALLHAYRNPTHERRLVERLRECGFEHVSGSAELAPLIKLLPRAETTIVDAYLGPIVHGYLREVARHLAGGRLLVMTSAGGLQPPEKYYAVDSLLSGPAGGVVGARVTGVRAGAKRIIGFDMGGTSTDVCRWAGRFEHDYDARVAGAGVLRPTLRIETVAAGGGSICSFQHERLQVGPRSAGAAPGPACYGAGGPLALTDVNLLAGRLDRSCFEIPLEPAASSAALRQVQQHIHAAVSAMPDEGELLDGFIQIANERMAGAISRISTSRGNDPAEHTLVAFGGAGGQHACAVAELLGIGSVVFAADASLLSAVGLGYATIERFAERQVLQPLDRVEREIDGWLETLGDEARREVAAASAGADGVHVRRRLVHLRLAGQETSIEVEHHPDRRLADDFRARYEAIYRHPPVGRAIEVESIRVIASAQTPPVERRALPPTRRPARADGRVRSRFGGGWVDVASFQRPGLRPGDVVGGPALILDRRTTVVLEPGWTATVDADRSIRCERDDAGGTAGVDPEAELVRQALFTSRLEDIVEDAGRMLQRTAISTNVKERLDFSCAVLDAEGRLVVNAPHIPVHLGAMGPCVRAVREVLSMEAGDVVVTNHPAFGGTHLPDVTVITPAFAEGRLLGYLASRAHHAEIGGSRPGSMPPASRRLAEEGVLIAPQHLMSRGRSRLGELERLLREAPLPSRRVEDNLADLQAAVAANARGVDRLVELAGREGIDELRRRMDAIRDRAARLTRAALGELGDGVRRSRETLDDGAAIEARLDIRDGEALVDFTGTSPTHPGNLNATPAIVSSAVMYVLRLLIGERLPLNDGILDAVRLQLPECLLSPRFPEDPAAAPAVAGGNVETSQRLVDTLLRGLELCACSQGTMNNVLFGDDRYGYYETVCGGAGAGPGFDGADAVHTHMTNTRLTDPEILEHRYPVRLLQFAIRRGSGGRGRWRGGDGVVRVIEFLGSAALSILSQHRREGPYGMAGGGRGAAGRQRVRRREGRTDELASVDGCDVGAGDRLVLETPGGGAWGPPPDA